MHFRKSVDTTFFRRWSPTMAYVLGYFAADGSMYVNSHGAKYIDFTSTDPVLLENVRTLLKAEHQIRLKRRRNPNPRWKPTYRIQIGGGELFDQLKSLGFTPNKDKSLAYPVIPSDCLATFVRGYFDGDGCISFGWYQQKNHRFQSLWVSASFASGSLNFLRQLNVEIQGATGMAAGYLRRRPSGCYLYYQRRGDLRKFYEFMYASDVRPGEYLPRKRDHFDKALILLGV